MGQTDPIINKGCIEGIFAVSRTYYDGLLGAARMECHFTNARHLILDRLAIDPDETECSLAPRWRVAEWRV